jgi:hypothetical protein
MNIMAKTVSKSSLQKTKRYKDGSTASFTKVANQAGKKQKNSWVVTGYSPFGTGYKKGNGRKKK